MFKNQYSIRASYKDGVTVIESVNQHGVAVSSLTFDMVTTIFSVDSTHATLTYGDDVSVEIGITPNGTLTFTIN